MSVALEVLLHKRRLNAALKELELDEVKSVRDKLNEIIEEREEIEKEEAEKRQRKEARIEALRKQMEEEGISPDEILGRTTSVSKKRKSLPPKYEYTDANGTIKQWTGQGRTPKAIQSELDKGVPIETFLISQK